MPLIIHHEVKPKQLKAVGQCEEGQFPAHCINALSCRIQGMVAHMQPVCAYEHGKMARRQARTALASGNGNK